MFVPFEELPGSTRIWVYPLSRESTQQENHKMEERLQAFCEQWGTHGTAMKTSFTIRQNHFLILAVDEQAGGASGCSIDSSVRTLKALHQELDIDFFDRTKVVFSINDQLIQYPVSQLKELFTNGTLKSETPTFNILAVKKEELDSKWMVPVRQTWLSRYLPKTTVA